MTNKEIEELDLDELTLIQALELAIRALNEAPSFNTRLKKKPIIYSYTLIPKLEKALGRKVK